MTDQQLRTVHAQACVAVARVDRTITPVDDRFWPLYLRAAHSAMLALADGPARQREPLNTNDCDGGCTR